jgi:hypothetical protein
VDEKSENLGAAAAPGEDPEERQKGENRDDDPHDRHVCLPFGE